MKRRRILVGGWGVAVIAGVAPLALSVSSGAEAKIRTPAVTALGPAKARAKLAAVKELADVQLSKGAWTVRGDQSVGRVLGPPTVLAPPRPACTNLLYDSGYWRVPGNPRDVLSWIAEHPPAQGTLSATGSGDAAPSDVQFAFPDQPGVRDRLLKVSIAVAIGGGSAIRADGIAVWEPRHGPPPCFRVGY